MDKRTSIFAVAQRAKCSIATVSNVLNNKGRGRLQEAKDGFTRGRGVGISSQFGRSKPAHPQIGDARPALLSFLCADLQKPFYAEIMEGLEEGLVREGYHLLLAGYQVSVADSPVPDFLVQGKVDGMILLGRFPNQIIQNFCKVSSPLLLLDSNVEWAIDSVISDGFTAEINVVNHLVSLGHRNIVMLAYEMEDYNIDLRIQGFLSGLSSASLSGGPSAVIREWLSHDDIYAALLNRLGSPNPPTAVVTVNDTLAMAMIKRLKDDGIRVPEQLSVVGYDDDIVITEGRPFLSTVRVDKRELGRIGAELILKRIASRDSPVVKLRLPTEFILRQSVAPPAAQI